MLEIVFVTIGDIVSLAILTTSFSISFLAVSGCVCINQSVLRVEKSMSTSMLIKKKSEMLSQQVNICQHTYFNNLDLKKSLLLSFTWKFNNKVHVNRHDQFICQLTYFNDLDLK